MNKVVQMKKQLSLWSIYIALLVTRVNKNTDSWSLGNRTTPGVYNIEKKILVGREGWGCWDRQLWLLSYLSFPRPGGS